MPITPLGIKKGVYKNVDERSLLNSDHAEDLINLLIDDAGTNIDRPTLQPLTNFTGASINSIGQFYFEAMDIVVIVSSDRNIWSLDKSNTILDITGDKLPGTKRPVFTSDGTSIFIIGGGQPIEWEGPGNLTALIKASLDPSNPLDEGNTILPTGTHIVFLDGYLLINDQDSAGNNTTFRWDLVGDKTSWKANNFASAESDPDALNSIVINLRELYLFGTKTIETWTNVGDPTSPFQRTFSFQYGTLSPYSPIVVDSSVFFLDSNRRFLKIVGRSPTNFGKPIEKEIRSYSVVEDCSSFYLEYLGKALIVFLFPTEKKAWCYDVSTDNWSEWRGWTEGVWERIKLNSLVYVPQWNRIFGGDYQSNQIWELSSSIDTDANGIFKRLRRFSFFDYGNSTRKRSNKARFKFRRGPITPLVGTSDQVTPVVEIRSRSDEENWGPSEFCPLGQTGEADSYIEVNRNGISRVRQWEISMTDPYPFKLISAEEDVQGLMR